MMTRKLLTAAALLVATALTPAHADDQISPDYKKQLSGWLESHKQYPETARQNSKTGTVGLRFRVDHNGKVKDYAVVSSSGFDDLDQSVKEMMRGAVLPAFPSDMTMPEIEVSVNVRFSLIHPEGSTYGPNEVNLSIGLTENEFNCVSKAMLSDMMWHMLKAKGINPNQVSGSPNDQVRDPIKDCNVPHGRWGAAMNQMMNVYRRGHGDDSTWIEEHCHAEPAIPRNKWVCKEEDMTWEWK
jgi:TonB family protein